MTHDQFRSHLAMLLRDQPAGTTADLLDYTVAYWDGHQVMGLHLSVDVPGFDDDFELTDEFLDEVPEAIADWIAKPQYTARAELLEWLKDTPPYDAYA